MKMKGKLGKLIAVLTIIFGACELYEGASNLKEIHDEEKSKKSEEES
jgi:hypothetical protein